MSSTQWWRSAVSNQIYPRSFMDSSATVLAILEAIIQKLPYVGFLGVDAMGVPRFYLSPMKDVAMNVSDYRRSILSLEP